jgi:hypothetical protein
MEELRLCFAGEFFSLVDHAHETDACEADADHDRIPFK